MARCGSDSNPTPLIECNNYRWTPDQHDRQTFETCPQRNSELQYQPRTRLVYMSNQILKIRYVTSITQIDKY